VRIELSHGKRKAEVPLVRLMKLYKDNGSTTRRRVEYNRMNAPTISLYIITFHVSMGRSASLKLQSNGDSAVETRTGRGQLTGNLVDRQGKTVQVDERAATSVCQSPSASNAHARCAPLYKIDTDYLPEGSSAGSWYGAT